MNKVYLSGVVFDQPKLISKPESEAHLVFHLQVSHKAKSGVQRELYRISAWNQCAVYCSTALERGMRVALQGYLTQRPLIIGDGMVACVEVALSEVFLPAPATCVPSPMTGSSGD